MTQHDWMSIMVRGAQRLEAVPFGLAIVDPRTGEIAWHNPAMTALLGHPVPPTVTELDALDIVPAEVRRQFEDIGRSLCDHDSYAEVDVTLERSDGTVTDLTVRIGYFHALRGDGAVLVATATDFDNTYDTADLERPLNPPQEIHVVYDLDLVAVAADQRHIEFGIDPAAQIGTQAMLLAHPEDAVAVNPQVRHVVAGRLSETRYTVRVLGPAAAWTRVSVRLSRFSGRSRFSGGEDLVLITNTPLDKFEEPFPSDRVDEPERAVALALLRGRRPGQIAEELGISVHTVRHRMTSLFRALGVDGQGEFRRSYYDASDPP